jgi:hypothetical protein
MNRDLFGGPLPRRFGRIPGIQQQLFEGAEWLGAAADWAAPGATGGLSASAFDENQSGSEASRGRAGSAGSSGS